MSQDDFYAAADTQSADSVWAEFNLHLQRSKGFCLVFLCSDSPRTLEWLRVRLDDTWTWRTAPLVLLRPESASGAAREILLRLQQEVGDRPAVRSPVWIDLATVDSAQGHDWNTARGEVMSRLNEWRSWLQAEFKRPLVFALPLVWRRRMAQVAPDLWHVRTYSAAVAHLPAIEARDSGPQHAAIGEALDRLAHHGSRSEALE